MSPAGTKSISRQFPGFAAVFWIGEQLSRRAYRGGVELPSGLVEWDLDLLSRGGLLVEESLIVRHVMGGSHPKDVVWTTSLSPLIVSEKVIAILTAN